MRTKFTGLLLGIALLTSACIPAPGQVAYRQMDENGYGSFWLAKRDGSERYEPFAWVGFVFGSIDWLPDGNGLYIRSSEVSNKPQFIDYLLADLNKGYIACISCGIEGSVQLYPSPKGDRLLQWRESGLYSSDLDGSKPEFIVDIEKPISASLSPDAQSLVFSAYDQKEYDYNIYKIDSTGGNLVKLVGGENGFIEAHSPNWSPRGDKIAYFGSGGLCVMNTDGSGRVALAPWNPWPRLDFYDVTITELPQWSPDGKWLAFASAEKDSQDMEIFVVGVEAQNLTNLTLEPESDDYNPVWSPDGKQIAFQSNRDGDWEIYVINADGSGLVNISQSPETDDEFPSWRPQPDKGALESSWLIGAGIVAVLLIVTVALWLSRRRRVALK